MSQAVVPVDTVITPDASGFVNRSTRLGWQLVLFTGSYYLSARVGLGFRVQSYSQIGVVWPANALLLSALLLAPRGRWWMVLAAAALAHAAVMIHVVPVWHWSWQIASDLLFVTVTAEVLRRLAGLPLHFGNRREVLVFAAISLGMSALSCVTAPAFVRSLLNVESIHSPGAVVLRTTLSNATVILLLTPVVLLWAQVRVRRVNELTARSLVEPAVIMMSLLTVGLIAFGTEPQIARVPSMLLWIFPPLLWAAVRTGPVGAATSLFCVAALSAWGRARQLGPFVVMTDDDQVVSLQLFWIVTWLAIMLLAAGIREREQAAGAPQEQRPHLAHVTPVATVDELSGALAHELRQPLTSILANAQAASHMLARDPVDLDELRTILKEIAQQDERAASVLAGFRGFLKESESRFEMLAVETVVHDALALSRSAIERLGVEVQLQIAAGLPRVRGDRVQLLQVVLNLVVNGCESMSGIPAQERCLKLQVAPHDETHVKLLIADSGVGLPKGREDRVFEPFFTTKDNGLGLGLAIGRSIVATHGGRLWGENNPDRGATFHLIL